MRSRRLLILASTIWFAFWGYSALLSTQERKVAEDAWFLADGAREWAAAEVYRTRAEALTHDIALAVLVGFVVPLALLTAFEFNRAATRRRTN